MAVHRTRFELERVLDRYGASDLAFVDVDANASVQFAVHGRYVQLALPLPDPNAAHFTHTPTGRPRTVAAQERAYEQALREHWRALLLAVRGKLQSVESGISTFENEFAGFLVPQFHEGSNGKRKKPKAVNWLLGSSHTLAIALVAAFLVPASAVSAFALPPSVVDRLSAPFRVAGQDEQAASDESRPFALGRSDWTRGESESDGEGEGFRVAAPAESEPTPDDGSNTDPAHASLPSSELAHSGDSGSTGSSHDAGPAPGVGQSSSAAKSDNEPAFVPADSVSAPDTGEEESSPPAGSEGELPSDGDGTPSSGEEVQPPSAGSDDEGAATPPGPDADPEAPGQEKDKEKDKDNGHDNGNHNGADNGHDNGNPNGTDNGHDNGNHTGAVNGTDNGHDNGNHNGADKGQKAGDRGSGKSKAEKG